MEFLSVPLVYVEIQPLLLSEDPSSGIPLLSAAFAKLQLQRLSVRSSLLSPVSLDHHHRGRSLYIQWDASSNSKEEQHQKGDGRHFASGYLTTTSCEEATPAARGRARGRVLPVLYLDHENPLLTEPCPCYCRGFAIIPLCSDMNNYNKACRETTSAMLRPAAVTGATMVRILLPVSARPGDADCDDYLWKSRLTGEWEEKEQFEEPQHVLQCHSPETIKQLTLRLKMVMSQPVKVGTTEDALMLHKRSAARQQSMRAALWRYQGRKASSDTTTATMRNFTNPQLKPMNGALLVHSPDHGAGKTSLVHALARNQLGCTRVHVIRPGPLFAKYGVHADAALETIVHEIALSAAVKNDAFCVILDDLDAMMPPSSSLSSWSMFGDAAAPVLNGIASYLKTLTLSLYERREIPFPAKNPLYNIGTRGWVVNVRMCLVAIVTCPDAGWQQLPREVSDRLPPSSLSSTTTILNSLHATGRFRLPTLTAETRLSAFRYALEQQKPVVVLSPELLNKLPFLAASAVWAHGRAFRRVAQQVHALALPNGMATVADFATALARIGWEASRTGGCSPQVEFLSSFAADDGGESVTAIFASSVGGNQQARIALEDALALDPGRRKLLESFGLSPPTGILLYGPPGTGKTLLAKAVAKLLRGSQNINNPLSLSSSSVGGAFISLSSSDVVRAEVGAGEKLVAAAFETARMNSPSVVFIDEFQALFMERSSGGSSRMTTTLLECMDDVRRWADTDKKRSNTALRDTVTNHHGNRVVVLAATNTPWMIDKAFMRPGRFDRSVHVGLPDDLERAAILRLHIGRMKTQFCAENKEDSLVDVCKRLSMESEGFSGADLAALCRAAAVRCLLENSDDGVEERHFFAARKEDVRPSSSTNLVKRIEQWHF